ncbi:autotransporter outer membrane beta-barrel domain-containing protein [Bradyrhizobium sp. McL0616]|uniref:autotransporter outer membrane beta-barrel domain-containing protein n=1 Tax=Bradyrhizobium sp. McL0616 TaxID=3415674 RepID=UPI003CE93A0A
MIGECLCARQPAVLLAAAGSAVLFVASILATAPALAACATSGTDPVSVTCAADTTTTNTTNNSTGIATVARIQSFNADLIGQVGSGVTIDGFGLDLVTTKASGGINFTNAGTVTTGQNVNALQLVGNGGAVTYGGVGTVTATGAGSGLQLGNTGSGSITATVGGAVTASNGSAISAVGVDGAVTVNVRGAISATQGGVLASTSGIGDVTVTTTAAGTIESSHIGGIIAQSSGGGGNVVVTTAGVIGGITPIFGPAIEATIANPASTGIIDVTVNANVFSSGQAVVALGSGGSVMVTGTGAITGGLAGIHASQDNTVSAANAGVHVGGSGDTAATAVGGTAIFAQIQGSANSGNVLVDRTGNVSGGNNGIIAQTLGSGNVTVTGVGNVVAGTGTGITASSSGGNGNVVVAPTGNVSGAVGIDVSAAGTGAVTVTSAAVTGTNGIAIHAVGVDGAVTVNVRGAISATQGGVLASTSGIGDVTVTTTAAGTIESSHIGGIIAQSSGGGGNVVVTTAGVIGGITPIFGPAIEATIANPASTGIIDVTVNANVFSSGQAVVALGSGGSVMVTGTGAITGGLAGIHASQDNTVSAANAGVHVGGSGDTAATAVGGTAIFAQIQGSANSGNVLVDRTGNVSGGNNGIIAQTLGSGNVTVTGVGNVVAGTGTGITASSSGGNGNIVVAPTGSVSGVIGIHVSAAGTGFSTVTVSNTVTGTGGTAIQFDGANNILTLISGYAVNGNVLGTGSDRLQLGGAANATFDASAIGPQYQGFSNLDKVGGSDWTLVGTSTFAGPVNVNAGTLSVNGSIVSASLLTVNAGGTLGGNGLVGNTFINGGTLAPGNSIGTLTVQGSLAFTAAASYMVEVSQTTSDRTNVTGLATLAGTVRVTSPTNSYTFGQSYTILISAGLNGTQFDSLVTPSGIAGSLIYSGGNVLLNLSSALGQIPGLNINQRAAANGLDAGFNARGNGSGPLGAIFAGNVPQNLTQASGELASGSQQATFDAMGQFMGLLTDPFIAGRGDSAAQAPANSSSFVAEDAANAYAAAGGKRAAAEREAYRQVTKAVPRNDLLDPRWSIWAAGFGGSQSTDGNLTLGSSAVTSRVFGTAAGADYLLSPRTIAGFALAGGGTNFSLANGLGGGRSDLFQAGVFVRHTAAAAYVTGALAYGWQDITTDRTVTIACADLLRARFNANAISGRLESGYRLISPWTGWRITPYAAGQFTTIILPAYAEHVLAGTNAFALAYGAKDATAARSELGLRGDKSFAMTDANLTLRGRLAWAHNFNIERSIGATFQTLPGASFVVNGAQQASDAALTSVSAEWKWRNGWSAAASFEGEFSDVTRSYAGRGAVRYAW